MCAGETYRVLVRHIVCWWDISCASKQ